jgi:CheY-like chemotaxis protein
MSATPPRSLAGLTILVVDDHRDTVDMFREYLIGFGASVIGAGNAKAALAVTETHVLDAVLVDLRMPGERLVVAARAAIVTNTLGECRCVRRQRGTARSP